MVFSLPVSLLCYWRNNTCPHELLKTNMTNPAMPEQNNTRAILITGCSSGIGRCVAQGLKQRGYRVFATARQFEDVSRLIDLGLESLQLDLNNSDSINLAVDEILSRTNGQLFALFNNGAYSQIGAVEDLSRDALRAQFETNFFGWHE